MTLLALLFSIEVARAENVRVVVIVSATNSITDISSVDLRAIYLGAVTRWPTRRAILPIILTTKSRETPVFIRRIIRMSDLDYAQHWIGVVFRGQAASAPLVASSVDEAARFVSAHPEAIAVVGGIPKEKGVRVLTVDLKSHDAPDYPLRW